MRVGQTELEILKVLYCAGPLSLPVLFRAREKLSSGNYRTSQSLKVTTCQSLGKLKKKDLVEREGTRRKYQYSISPRGIAILVQREGIKRVDV